MLGYEYSKCRAYVRVQHLCIVQNTRKEQLKRKGKHLGKNKTGGTPLYMTRNDMISQESAIGIWIDNETLSETRVAIDRNK